MGEEGVLPAPEIVAELRSRFKEYIAENGSDDFDQRDVDRFFGEEYYAQRFYMHVESVPGNQMDTASTMVVNTLKFRRETGMADIKHDSIPEELKLRGSLFYHGRDIDNKRLLIFRVRTHVRNKELMDKMKLAVLYQLERLEREDGSQPVTLVFDLSNCGLKNMDMDFIQYLIGVFRDYSPWSLNYILVYEMPWVLNAAWKVIKGWLPAAGVKKIKFLSKATMGEYVREDSRLVEWGGTDAWEYEFDAGPEVGDAKADQLADLTMSPGMNNNNDGLLKLSPANDIVFDKTSYGDLVAKLTVANATGKAVIYKIKTTSPDKYKVRPSMFNLAPGASNQVEIHVQSLQIGSAASLVRDKFLITAVTVDETGLSNSRIAELMKTAKPESQYRLRCLLSASATVGETQMGNGVDHKPTSSQVHTLDTISKRVAALSSANSDLLSQVSSLKFLVVLLLFLSLATFALLAWHVVQSEAAVAAAVSAVACEVPAAAAHIAKKVAGRAVGGGEL
jgi:hypothetical protein